MRSLAYSMTLAALVGLASGCAAPHATPGRTEVKLAAPEAAAERAYLGLSEGTAEFKLEDICCEMLVVDCFDLYCHICQSGAERVNSLNTLIQEHGLGQRVKVIGLGVGDAPLEVATYRDKLKVPFPLLSDRHSDVARSLGPLKVPNLIVLRKQGGRLTPIYSNPGELRNPEEFLAHLQTSLGGSLPAAWAKPLRVSQATCEPGSSTCRRPTGAAAGLFQ